MGENAATTQFPGSFFCAFNELREIICLDLAKPAFNLFYSLIFSWIFFNSGIFETLNKNNVTSTELICIIVLVTFVEFHMCMHV